MTAGQGASSRVGDVARTVGAVSGVVLVTLVVVGTLLGARVLVFRSGSMAPAIPSGALALSVPDAAADLARGDVVSVRRPDGVRVTHRVVHSRPLADGSYALDLKGDANSGPDAAPYAVRSVDRVVTSVPVLGRVVATVRGVLPGLALGLLLAFAGARWRRRRVPAT